MRTLEQEPPRSPYLTTPELLVVHFCSDHYKTAAMVGLRLVEDLLHVVVRDKVRLLIIYVVVIENATRSVQCTLMSLPSNAQRCYLSDSIPLPIPVFIPCQDCVHHIRCTVTTRVLYKFNLKTA